ncbi:hypothetical protein ABLA30_10950 [Xenorhabdus nematophila]|uniref:hypothetical protein n=1 Tax=Xenorhabdus nematophila TaxID=628 RepID=UPI0003275B43|nr:hypothetical protein [Xenorhabdus nematophila]CCW31595.1 hypothetical protein XNC3_2670025 [Xenorhabdus nematophila F1]
MNHKTLCYSSGRKRTSNAGYATRVFGIDNAHAISIPKKGKYKGRIVYDHMHRNSYDKGVPYEFTSPYQLIEDFFAKIDEVIAERESRG